MDESNRTQALNSPAFGTGDPTPDRPAPTPGPETSDPTRSFSALQTPNSSEDPLADPERRRQLETDLTRLGMAPEEIRRLLDAREQGVGREGKREEGKGNRTDSSDLPVRSIPNVSSIPTKPASSAGRVTAEDLQSFAAQLTAAKTVEPAPRAQTAAISMDLPPFRESTVQEKLQAEPLLRDAGMLRRQEKFREAELKCRQALQLVPRDAAALELLGDLLQGVAHTEEALAVYQRAMQADARRYSAEKKYADLLIRRQNIDLDYDPEAVPPNPVFTTMLSLCLPGMGQVFNGEIGKAIFFFVCDLLCAFLIFWSPWGFAHKRGAGIGASLLASMIFTGVVYLFALVDTQLSLKKKSVD